VLYRARQPGKSRTAVYDPDQGRGPLFALVSDDLAAFWRPTSADPHTRPDRPLIRPTPVLLEGDQRIAIRQASF